MGIVGLTSLVENELNDMFEHLTFQSQSMRGIVVDEISFLFNCAEQTKISLRPSSEWDHFKSVLLNRIHLLRSVFQPVIFVSDGTPPGIKDETVTQRYKQRAASAYKMYTSLVKKGVILQQNNRILPQGLIGYAKNLILNQFGKDISYVQAVSEGDAIVADIARKLNAYTLGFDADFYIYACNYLPSNHFIFDDDKQQITCKLFNQEKFMEFLEVKTHLELCLCASLIGNDYLRESAYFKRFKDTSKKIQKAAHLVVSAMDAVSITAELPETQILSSILDELTSSGVVGLSVKSKIKFSVLQYLGNNVDNCLTGIIIHQAETWQPHQQDENLLQFSDALALLKGISLADITHLHLLIYLQAYSHHLSSSQTSVLASQYAKDVSILREEYWTESAPSKVDAYATNLTRDEPFQNLSSFQNLRDSAPLARSLRNESPTQMAISSADTDTDGCNHFDRTNTSDNLHEEQTFRRSRSPNYIYLSSQKLSRVHIDSTAGYKAGKVLVNVTSRAQSQALAHALFNAGIVDLDGLKHEFVIRLYTESRVENRISKYFIPVWRPPAFSFDHLDDILRLKPNLQKIISDHHSNLAKKNPDLPIAARLIGLFASCHPNRFHRLHVRLSSLVLTSLFKKEEAEISFQGEKNAGRSLYDKRNPVGEKTLDDLSAWTTVVHAFLFAVSAVSSANDTCQIDWVTPLIIDGYVFRGLCHYRPTLEKYPGHLDGLCDEMIRNLQLKPVSHKKLAKKETPPESSQKKSSISNRFTFLEVE
eukprot:gene17-3413_t